jgi:hypothetical protein
VGREALQRDVTHRGLDVPGPRRPRIIGRQVAAAPQPVRDTRLMEGLIKLSVRRPPVADAHAVALAHVL